MEDVISTLPRLHQKHSAASGASSGGPFSSFTPEPYLAIPTWKIGLNGGFGLMAAIRFSSLASTHRASRTIIS